MRRRALLAPALAAATATLLAGCGFRLRGAMRFAFDSIHIGANTPVAADLRRALAVNGLQVFDSTAPPERAAVVLTLGSEQRQRVVAGRSASGQVRELQLRILLRFSVRSARGVDLIGDTELLQQRDISYSETAALSKEAEEVLLFNDMQSDLVQQLMRRLAAIKA